jgi:hypothetical protein
MFDHFFDMEMDFAKGFMLVLVEVVTNVGRFLFFGKPLWLVLLTIIF